MHTCTRVFKNKFANKKRLADQLVDELWAHPNLVAEEAFEFFMNKRNVYVDDFQVYRSLRLVRNIIEGTEKERYY